MSKVHLWKYSRDERADLMNRLEPEQTIGRWQSRGRWSLVGSMSLRTRSWGPCLASSLSCYFLALLPCLLWCEQLPHTLPNQHTGLKHLEPQRNFCKLFVQASWSHWWKHLTIVPFYCKNRIPSVTPHWLITHLFPFLKKKKSYINNDRSEKSVHDSWTQLLHSSSVLVFWFATAVYHDFSEALIYLLFQKTEVAL